MSQFISLQAISHSFTSESPVLENLTLEIQKSEIFILIGPSGAGKTTLLRIMNLLDKPRSGRIHFLGVDMWLLSERERRCYRQKMGMVFQNNTLFEGTVKDNVAYGLRIRHYEKNLIDEKVAKALATVGLTSLKDRHVRTLSGGEIQRTAIARILAYDPELLILDEPTANLDPSNTANLERIIAQIRKDYHSTIIYATHNMFQAKRLGDRIALLLNHQIIECNSADQFFSHPTNPLTKSFINGEMIY